jgi:hypothetical protein
MSDQPLQHYFLLGGLTGADLWPAINLVFFSYLLLFFVPRWQWTPSLTLATPLFHSVLYVGSLFSYMAKPKENASDIDFNTLEGIATMFKDIDVIFPAWIHYIVFDLLVSRMVVLDSIGRGASTTIHVLVVVPCVFCTFMFGPTGFLGYMILREIVLPSKSGGEKVKIL